MRGLLTKVALIKYSRSRSAADIPILQGRDALRSADRLGHSETWGILTACDHDP